MVGIYRWRSGRDTWLFGRKRAWGSGGRCVCRSVRDFADASFAGFAGNRLGAIRDAKGKSVAQVFGGLQSSQKAEVSCLDAQALLVPVLSNILDSSSFSFQGTREHGIVRPLAWGLHETLQ